MMKNSINKCMMMIVMLGMLLSTGVVIAQEPFSVAEELPTQLSTDLTARTTGGPDEFGYIWDDGVDYEWIDAKTDGTNLGLYGSNENSGSVNIGFSFPFYENTYNEVYITTSGWITFDSLPLEGYNFYQSYGGFISPKSPNNLIAVLWERWNVQSGEDGAIYTLQGENTNGKFFVVEWHNVYKEYSTSYKFTFQVILHENGKIVMQYKTISYGLSSNCAVGIEDSRGMDGIKYPNPDSTIEENKAIKFTPPAASKRIFLSPLNQGSLTNLVSQDYELQLINIGTAGEDTYTLSTDTVWDVSFFEGDSEITEPIVLSQGQSKTIIARVYVPSGTEAAEDNTATITVTSSEPLISKTATIYSAVPAPFAQVYVDGQVSTYLVSPQELRQVDIHGLSINDTDTQMATLELPNSNLLYAWSQYRGDLGKQGWMIHYSILNRDGNVVRERTLLSDLSGGGAVRKDFAPSLAVTPDGRIGVLWVRSDEESAHPYRTNPHLRFAILDINGSVVKSDHNITEDIDWHYGIEEGRAWYYRPNITATHDGLFVVSWIKSSITYSSLYVYDVYYKVLDAGGVIVYPITNLTNSVYPYPPFDNMTMTALADGRIFFALTVDEELKRAVNYMVVDLDGEEVIPMTRLSEYWGALDVVQLSDGSIFLAGNSATQIKYIIFDGAVFSYGDILTLPDEIGSNVNEKVSVTSDSQAHAILTYQTKSPATGKDMIMYALVDSLGNVVTKPVPFHTAHTANLIVSSFGQSITTYTPETYTEAPEITSDDTTTFTVGEPGTFTVLTTGEPTPDDITYSGVLPNGVTFTNNNNSTATLSGMPEDGTGGIYWLTITASNGIEPDAIQEFTLIVATAVVVDGTEEVEISSSGGDILITIPAGAVDGEATFTFVPQAEPYTNPGSLSFAGVSFLLTAEDNLGTPITEFDEPLIITITYDPVALGEIDPETLRLYYWDGTNWEDAICEGAEYTRNMDENWFSLPICHLSQFAVLGEVPTGFNIFLPLIRR